MNTHTLSVCAIAGDDHIHLLPRMVQSLIVRPGGPACQEIVIGWNGQNDLKLGIALEKILGAAPDPIFLDGQPLDIECDRVRFLIFRQQWEKNFSKARQETFDRASGIWRLYMDLDDVLAMPDDPLVAESIGSVSHPGVRSDSLPRSTLWEWLATRAPHVNVIQAPYNYAISDTRRALIVKRRPRIVRWLDHDGQARWSWIGEVHEVLRHTLGREVAVWNGGILLIHDPPLTAADRSRRNLEIHQGVVDRGGELTPAMNHGSADADYGSGKYTKAAETFEKLAKDTMDSEELIFYWSMVVRSYLEMDAPLVAGRKALELIAVAPNRPEGYLLACEAAYQIGSLEYAVQWYEAGGQKSVPVGVMIDDRIARLIRPAYNAAPAYLYLGLPEKALEVAEKALEMSSDGFAARIVLEAKAMIKDRKMARTLADTLDALAEYPGVALSAAAVFGDLLKGEGQSTILDLQKRVKDVIPIAPDSRVAQWMLEGKAAASSLVPLDSSPDPDRTLEEIASTVADDGDIFVCARIAGPRISVITAEGVLAKCEIHGSVQDLMLIAEDGQPNTLAARTVKKKVTTPWIPDVTLFCPAYVEPWGPWRLWQDGTGGSEESAIYLAREFASRGLRVQVYAPLDRKHAGVHVEDGVRWRPLDALDMTRRIPGLTIAHRAPSAIRLPCFNPKQTYVWHQDAGYIQGWDANLARAQGHLFVSRWQRDDLLRQVGLVGEAVRSIIVGNGIPESALAWGDGAEATPRDPLACAYISSPIRGLDNLLDIWPDVRGAFPLASLHVYYGWATMPADPDLAKTRDKIMARIYSTSGVIWHGRVPSLDLEAILPTLGVWLYPCIFAESFCISGIRAVAAGLVPVYRKVAAMGECQYPGSFTVENTPWKDGGREEFLKATLRGLEASVEKASGIRSIRNDLRDWARDKTWPRMADLMVAEFKAKGLL